MGNSETADRPTSQSLRADRLAVWLGAAGILAALLIQSDAYLNHDVAFLAWANGAIFDGRRYGVDFYESNAPLAILIYAPGWFLGKLVGPGIGVKIWVALLASTSLALVWHSAGDRLRAWLVPALGLYFGFAFAREFGQREQLALLLCAPWVAGHMKDRHLAVLSGIMAGLGLAIKPYFLAAMVLVFLVRPKVRTEEWAIAVTGAIYAGVILVFFPDYLWTMIPITREVYWAFEAQDFFAPLPVSIAAATAAAVIVWLRQRRRETAPLLAAAMGFGAAAIVQFKWYPYHLIAVGGMLVLFFVTQGALVARQRLMCVALLAVTAVPLVARTVAWGPERDQRNRETAALLAEIDRSSGFSAITVHPYPASPALLYATRHYLGLSNGQWFLPAAAQIATGQVNRPMGRIESLATGIAVAELRRQPELVIVNPDWRSHSSLARPFDAIAWLSRDARFRELWNAYRPAGTIGIYRLYRRACAGASPHSCS